jgi:Protein of unknown function (DUF3788)
MLANAFAGKPGQPTEVELAATLGPAKSTWDKLLAQLAQKCDLATQEWNSYSRKAGWSLRLKHGDRNIVYLSPGSGCFLASFALGDKAVRAARESKLPRGVLDLIASAKRYAEGTAVRLEVHAPKDIVAVIKLAAIKLGN